MPPKAKRSSVLVMVTNVGSTSLEQNSLEDEPFIDKAKYAMKMLVEKKIFLQPKDEIGIITMGDETDNSQDINYVKEYKEHLLIPNWEMVKYINDLSSKNYPCNWIEALHVAICFIKREVLDPNCLVYIVIFNNFKEDADSIVNYDADTIINDLNNFDNLHLLFVGENPLEEKSKQNLSPSEQFALSVTKRSKAQYEQIHNFIEARKFFNPPPTNSMPWKFNLNWAGLNIGCSNYVKITEGTKHGPWKMVTVKDDIGDRSNTKNISNTIDTNINQKKVNEIKDEIKDEIKTEVTRVVKSNIILDVHRNEINPENIISGYKFGGKYIPFSDDDEMAMKYTGTEKGMMVYGFVPQDEVTLECWTGSGSRLIVPETSDDAVAFYSLVQAMVEKKYAAIVRKVYANNNLPKMGVLFPKVDDDEVWGLVHIELPFINDYRIIKKKPIQSLDNTINEEKLTTLDEFIDAMTIDSEPNYLNTGMFPNISNQYYWNAVSDRVINPKGPLLPVNQYLKKFLEPPEEIINQAKQRLDKLHKVFGTINFSKPTKKTEKSAPVISKIGNIITGNKDGTSAISNGAEVKKDKDEVIFAAENLDMSMGELDDL